MRTAARVAERFGLDPLTHLDTPLLDQVLRVAALVACQHDDEARAKAQAQAQSRPTGRRR